MEPQTTALLSAHRARNARLVPFAGYLMPVLYTGVVAEHTAVRAGAGLFDISHMARVEVTGAGALGLLERTFTNHVANLKPGQVRYGCVCNERGGVLDDVLVTFWGAGEYLVVVNASNRAKILAHWASHNVNHSAVIADTTDRTAMIAVQGPKAGALVGEVLGEPVGELRYYFAKRTTYRGGPCVVSRTGYTGEDGFELSVPAESGVGLWDELAARGGVPCGLGARDTLRLEAGMPLYGHELDEATTPVEARLDWAVKLEKDFLGRDALKSAAPRKLRVGLELAGKRAARETSPILVHHEVAGVVTSGSYAPGLEKSIAMGYLPPGAANLGQAVEIDIRGTLAPATVVALPFYRRAKV